MHILELSNCICLHRNMPVIKNYINILGFFHKGGSYLTVNIFINNLVYCIIYPHFPTPQVTRMCKVVIFPLSEPQTSCKQCCRRSQPFSIFSQAVVCSGGADNPLRPTRSAKSYQKLPELRGVGWQAIRPPQPQPQLISGQVQKYRRRLHDPPDSSRAFIRSVAPRPWMQTDPRDNQYPGCPYNTK